jgi:hypothetical protein
MKPSLPKATLARSLAIRGWLRGLSLNHSRKESTMTTHGPPNASKSLYCNGTRSTVDGNIIGRVTSGCGSVFPDRLGGGQRSANIAAGH